MFPEYSRNIPQMFPRYCKVMKISLEVKKFEKVFCGLSCENLNIGSLISCNVYVKLIEASLHLG